MNTSYFNKKILVVDDSDLMRIAISMTLNNLGFSNYDEAEDGLEAIGKLRSDKYDFVITDWNMPRMNGLKLLSEIRHDEALKHIPVLLVSSETGQEYIREAFDTGVNGYISKPFTRNILDTTMNQIFSQLQ